jgi:mRNA-degrading endonuclease toxin of MazEF toxin-antitoxin module
MSVGRGDVGLANVNFASGGGAKVRPVLVVQTDTNNARLQTTIVAIITSNTSRVGEATQLLIDVSTPDGAASGLLYHSAIKAENLLTIMQSDIRRVIGRLPRSLMDQFGECIKASLEIT